VATNLVILSPRYGEPWWNNIGNEKLKNWENTFQYIQYKSHMEGEGANPGLRVERPVANRLIHDTAKKVFTGCISVVVSTCLYDNFPVRSY
jgi:hypothetical protein